MNRDTANNRTQRTQFAKENIALHQEAIIEGKNVEITGLKTALKKESRKLKWTKIGWAGTSVVFTGIITALLLK